MIDKSVRRQSGSNLKEVKLLNRAVVFRTIREAGVISRAELARQIGLNPATLTHITRELLEQGLIEEVGFGESQSGGRRPSLLRVRAEQGYVIAVYLSRHYIQGMITDLDLQEIHQKTITSSSLSHPIEITLPDVLDLIQTLIASANKPPESIIGIGICAPGPLDARQGLLISPPNFPGWPLTPIRQIVADKTGFPVYLDNDANAAALSEKWFGLARDKENYIFILIEDGVGSGIMIDGDLYRGEHDVAGEIGHMTINMSGPRCDCGNYGCLELYAIPRIAEELACEEISQGADSLISRLADGCTDRVSFDLIAKAAQQEDPLAIQIFARIADALAVGIVNIVNTFDPEVIYLGGKYLQVGKLFTDLLQTRVDQRSILHNDRQVPILASGLGADAPIVGAFSLVLRKLFENPAMHQFLPRNFTSV